MGLFDFLFGKKKPNVMTAGAPEHPSEDSSTLKPGQNTGVIEMPPTEASWIRGGETGAQKRVLEESGQYDEFLPDEEPQSFYTPAHFDTQSCVSFSASNDVETYIHWLLAHNVFSKRVVDFLINDGYVNPQTGKVNVSDRFVAKMSGTTQNGNNLEAVANAIRNFGLVPESMWPVPDWDALKGKSQDEVWNIYMAEIPQNVKAQGLKWKKYITINHEWCVLGQTPGQDTLEEILKYGPFQIAAAVCSPWNSNQANPPIKACGCGAGHATMIYGWREKDLARKLFDHYRSFRKFLASDYCIPWGVQYLVKETVETNTFPIEKVFKIQLAYGMPDGAEVNALQKALQDLKSPKTGKAYMARGVFGPFGPQTRAALAAFQVDHGIFGNAGMDFGPKTRAAMNTALVALAK